jgi:ATP-dependent DNA helicase RecG
LLAFRHFVQTFARRGAPSTTMRSLWMFGFQRRRLRRWECEILFPKPGVFPQMSHTDAIRSPMVSNPATLPSFPTSVRTMADVVTAPPRGLELFAPPGRRKPLAIAGKRGRALGVLGVTSVQDLLQHYPRTHVDRTKLRTVRELGRLASDGHTGDVQVHGKVIKIGRPFRTKTGKRLISGRIGDETGSIAVMWFNQDWIARALSPGDVAFFYGRLGIFGGKLQMTAPRFELVRTGKEPFNVGRIVPIYPATADLSSDQLRKLIWETLDRAGEILDPLPDNLRTKLRLMARSEAVRLIHFPDEKQDVIDARRRLIFDEVFTLQLGLVYRKRKLERTVQGIEHPPPGPASLAESFVSALPFEPTGAQRRACDEVARDLSMPYPMHRLVEGEVGSGKTVVALYACLIAIGGGSQAAFMAPTEVLAEQHYLTVKDLLDRAFGTDEALNLFKGISRRPVVRLLTGSTPASPRDETLMGVAAGEVDLLIGTHALIQDAVSFARLGIAVVDEQHRFGVHQRKALREKGALGEPDILVMTATPIPRTLAVTIYGDLDVTILDELPKGRKPVTTMLAAGEDGRGRAYDLIRREVAAGRQAFVVYALRDESNKTELRNAKSEAKRLAAEVFPDLNVGLVHGDMRSADKEAVMTEFRAGAVQVLVATTVIEVGVDVPNASVMLIEDAERFGLAQLHQLRGRIGRGEYESFCVLATELDLGKAEEDPGVRLIAERLQAVVSMRDGFELAMVDLEHRGEGQLFGSRQSGLPQLKIARVLEHQDIVKLARDVAVSTLEKDPELRAHEHIALAREMRDRFFETAIDVVQSG